MLKTHMDDIFVAQTPSKGFLTLLDVLFKIVRENHRYLCPNTCEFLKEVLEGLGFDLGYSQWAPSENNFACAPRPQLHQIRDTKLPWSRNLLP